MLRRTRVSSTADTSRISQAVARPGIDPRVWCSLAVALAEEHFDKEHGCFIDVRLIPNGEELTCYVPQSYTGKDFGEHQPAIHKDDQLLIVVPNGDPAEGGVVLTRFHSKEDKPPELAEKNPKDFVRVQEKDTNARWAFDGKALLTVKIGDFEVTIDNSSSPTVASFKTEDGDVWRLTKDGLELGLDHDDKMALAQKTKDEIEALRDAVNTLKNTFNDHVHQVKGIKTSGSPVAQTQTAPVDSEKTGTAGPSIPTVNDVNSTFVKAN